MAAQMEYLAPHLERVGRQQPVHGKPQGREGSA